MAHVLILSPPSPLIRVMYEVDQSVGVRGFNRRDDVMLVQFFLRALARVNDVITRESYFPPGQAMIDADGIYGPQTAAYIKHFEAVLERSAPGSLWQDGVIDPRPQGQKFGPLHGRAYAIIRLNTLYAESFGIDRHFAIDKDLDFPAELRPKLFVA
jgi:peptidoglycan hydrolase-like protein with peptidoglycan-binding domain